LSYLWGALNDLSSLTMLSLISLNLPGEATIIQKAIIQISQLDIFPSEIIVDLILTFDN